MLCSSTGWDTVEPVLVPVQTVDKDGNITSSCYTLQVFYTIGEHNNNVTNQGQCRPFTLKALDLWPEVSNVCST